MSSSSTAATCTLGVGALQACCEQSGLCVMGWGHLGSRTWLARRCWCTLLIHACLAPLPNLVS